MVRCGGAGTPSRRLSQQLYLLFIADKAHNLWVVQKFKCPRECQETKSQGISLGDGSLTVGQLTSGPVGCAASGRVNYTCVHLSRRLAPSFVLSPSPCTHIIIPIPSNAKYLTHSKWEHRVIQPGNMCTVVLGKHIYLLSLIRAN